MKRRRKWRKKKRKRKQLHIVTYYTIFVKENIIG